MISELVKSISGTRDDAQSWEGTYCRALSELGFRRGRVSACIFRHAKREISLTVHGDDFLSTAVAFGLDWFEHALLTKFEENIQGRLCCAGDQLRA